MSYLRSKAAKNALRIRFLENNVIVKPFGRRSMIRDCGLRDFDTILDIASGDLGSLILGHSLLPDTGFRGVPEARREALLRGYWTVPDAQIAASVVLADVEWWRHQGGGEIDGSGETHR